MLTFEPDSPWKVGQVVLFRKNGQLTGQKIVVSVEHSADGRETQYELHNLT